MVGAGLRGFRRFGSGFRGENRFLIAPAHYCLDPLLGAGQRGNSRARRRQVWVPVRGARRGESGELTVYKEGAAGVTTLHAGSAGGVYVENGAFN